MQMRRLGRTGLQVSVLGVGGHTYPVGHGPDSFCTPDERARIASVSSSNRRLSASQSEI